ncbi:protein translocase subunit SecE [Legionella impletisoli]|uniref:Protein translocase subunit SecE n=2 Tax=Legionella impletisoli TaxID=343510 RepID=A0A917JTB9_9GAMM|nr:preprotein translocase subunit SecE [Legionella impletisoli]GGI83699.1 protein translocase subunit SecE [Legionella impletisoli]
MKKIENSTSKIMDIFSWLGIALITAAAFIGTYHYHFTAPIVALIWVCWLVLTFVFGYLTSTGKAVFAFAKESKVELQKVVWPTRQETIQTTSIVMAMVAVTGLILWGIDAALMWVIGKITHLG